MLFTTGCYAPSMETAVVLGGPITVECVGLETNYLLVMPVNTCGDDSDSGKNLAFTVTWHMVSQQEVMVYIDCVDHLYFDIQSIL